jgi:hypothetical protein
MEDGTDVRTSVLDVRVHDKLELRRLKVVGEIRALARRYAPEAFERICEPLDSDDERIALAASQENLNRAHGGGSRHGDRCSTRLSPTPFRRWTSASPLIQNVSGLSQGLAGRHAARVVKGSHQLESGGG